MRVTVLGCGASTGVPAIGPNWGRCDPSDPRNRRRRVSALVEIGSLAIPVVPFAQDHGFSTTLGLRIGAFAYSTDVTEFDETAFAAIEGIELWVVDCLRREPHPTHSHLAKTLSWIDRVRPRRAVLTHMDQSLDYCELSAELPSGVEPGRDGLVIELPDPIGKILAS